MILGLHRVEDHTDQIPRVSLVWEIVEWILVSQSNEETPGTELGGYFL